ncbi:MAG TPA: dihydroxyacetone kinase, partial [Frankiaceae bacterium]|nr:dihydroxyacetone kinase [Frankiaceae bacterium]
AVTRTAVTRTAAGHAGADRDVAVVPTRSPVQGLAALAVGDPDRPFADDVAAMAVAAGAARYAALTRAVRPAGTPAGPVRAGDVLGLLGDEVVVVGPEVHPVATGLLERMLAGGGELVTLVVGANCPPDLPDRLVAHLAAVAPSVEVVTYDGGQPHYPLLMGVE